MAKSKYDAEIFPLLAEEYARDGYSDKEIFQQLAIGKNTYYKYLKKYKDFSDAIKRGRVPINLKVEKAFLSRCLGIEYEQVNKRVLEVPKVTVTRTVDTTGKVINTTEDVQKQRTVQVSTVQKRILPHVGACKHWLRTKKGDVWNKKEGEEEATGFKSFADLMLAIREEDKGNGKKEKR